MSSGTLYKYSNRDERQGDFLPNRGQLGALVDVTLAAGATTLTSLTTGGQIGHRYVITTSAVGSSITLPAIDPTGTTTAGRVNIGYSIWIKNTTANTVAINTAALGLVVNLTTDVTAYLVAVASLNTWEILVTDEQGLTTLQQAYNNGLPGPDLGNIVLSTTVPVQIINDAADTVKTMFHVSNNAVSSTYFRVNQVGVNGSNDSAISGLNGIATGINSLTLGDGSSTTTTNSMVLGAGVTNTGASSFVTSDGSAALSTAYANKSLGLFTSGSALYSGANLESNTAALTSPNYNVVFTSGTTTFGTPTTFTLLTPPAAATRAVYSIKAQIVGRVQSADVADGNYFVCNFEGLATFDAAAVTGFSGTFNTFESVALANPLNISLLTGGASIQMDVDPPASANTPTYDVNISTQYTALMDAL